jgi:hypothetical protein
MEKVEFKRNQIVFILEFKFTEIGCRAHGDCLSQKACINGVCADPCATSSPCLDNQECQVLDHQPVCIKGKNS